MTNLQQEMIRLKTGKDMTIRMIAADMDGTCLNSRSRMTKRTIDALNMLQERGIILVPATGRSLSCLPKQCREDCRFRYCITSNGAKVYDIQEKKVLFDASIPKDTAAAFLKRLHKKNGIAGHVRGEYVIEGRIGSLIGKLVYGRDAQDVYYTPSLIRYLDEMNGDCEELQLFYTGLRDREKISSALQEFAELTEASADFYTEIYTEQASKGSAVSFLQEYLHIPKEDCACIGNDLNDIPMFEACGISAAMDNAKKQVKEHADLIAGHNDKDGVVRAIAMILENS